MDHGIWIRFETSCLALAMNCVGNCVAPVQVVQVWTHLQPGCILPPFGRLVKAMMLGRHLAHSRALSLPVPAILVFVDSLLAPFHLDLSQDSCALRFFEAFNVPARWSIQAVHPFLVEDHLTLVATLQTVLVCLSGCTLQVSPLFVQGWRFTRLPKPGRRRVSAQVVEPRPSACSDRIRGCAS